MSGIELRFAAGTAGALQGYLQRLALADAQGFLRARGEVGEYMLGEVQDNLDHQKLADGSAMPQSKAAIKRRGKTLIAKHNLYDSYVWQPAAGGVVVGSNSVYAAIHHFGGVTGSRRGRFTMIARPVLGAGPEQERRIGDILIAEIERVM